MARRPSPQVAPFEGVDAAAREAAEMAARVLPVRGVGNRWMHTADVFGRLVAQGLEDHEAALAAMKVAAAARFPEMDAAGRDMRVAHTLRDAVEKWRATRDRTRFAIRRALGPLLAERAKSGQLMAVARAANEAAGWPLQERDVLAVVRNEVYWAARRAAKVAAA
jgi:hypothetical protein